MVQKIISPEPEKLTGGAYTMQEEVRPLGSLSDQEFAELGRKMLVIIPTTAQEGISVGLWQASTFWARMGVRLANQKDPNGGFVEVNRGGMVNMFMEAAQKDPTLEYMVCIDNDEDVNWDIPFKLAMHDKPVVSGVVCGWTPERGIFACFTALDANGIARFPSWNETGAMPTEGLIEAYQVGGGLLCIRKDVIEKMCLAGENPFEIPHEIKSKSIRDGKLYKGEDICFSERVKAHGYKIYVDLSCHAVHWKTIPLSWPQTHLDPNLEAIEWKPSKNDYAGVM